MERDLEDAVALREAGRSEEARAALEALALERPDDPHVQYQLAWACDAAGDEHAAVPAYERALALGLAGGERRGALLGLGSTYRTLGDYDRAVATLERGLAEHGDDGREFAVFLAMALHNRGEHGRAMELALRVIAETSADPNVARYTRAIALYAGDLDRVWE